MVVASFAYVNFKSTKNRTRKKNNVRKHGHCPIESVPSAGHREFSLLFGCSIGYLPIAWSNPSFRCVDIAIESTQIESHIEYESDNCIVMVACHHRHWHFRSFPHRTILCAISRFLITLKCFQTKSASGHQIRLFFVVVVKTPSKCTQRNKDNPSKPLDRASVTEVNESNVFVLEV